MRKVVISIAAKLHTEELYKHKELLMRRDSRIVLFFHPRTSGHFESFPFNAF